MVIAVREALETDTRKAALVVCGALAVGLGALGVLSFLLLGRWVA